MLQMLTEKVVIAVTSLIQPVLTVGVSLAEKGLIPDVLVRVGIRCMLLESKAQLVNGTTETLQDRIMQFVFDAKKREIAEAPSDANKQHYEVDATFFKHVLGPHIKYSCCYFPRKDASLAEAEFRMLDLVMQRADVSDGHTILDLGCGWGSFALHAAYHCPHSTVHAVSNSKSQKDVIEAEALKLGLNNLSVFCADVNHWNAPTRYDRIISLEMFEHMKNYTKLLKRVHSWLKPQNQSKLFVHIFTHHTMPYHFEDTGGASGWMTRHFFSGGTMPSDTLLVYFLPGNLRVDNHWHVSGTHYFRTCQRWLTNLDQKKEKVMDSLKRTYGDGVESTKWFYRWRLFFLACQELWRSDHGNTWIVTHMRFERTD